MTHRDIWEGMQHTNRLMIEGWTSLLTPLHMLSKNVKFLPILKQVKQLKPFFGIDDDG